MNAFPLIGPGQIAVANGIGLTGVTVGTGLQIVDGVLRVDTSTIALQSSQSVTETIISSGERGPAGPTGAAGATGPQGPAGADGAPASNNGYMPSGW